MNKLAQLLYVALIAALVFIVQMYAGPMMSKPIRTNMIVIKPALQNTAKKVRKKNKARRQKITKQEKVALAKNLADLDGEPDWDFCERVKFN